MKTETRDFVASVELRADDDGPRRLVGLAAPFYRAEDPSTEFRLWDGAVERYMPGAFTNTVMRDDIRATFNHNFDNLLGRTKSGTLSLEINERGLWYDIQASDTSAFRDVSALIDRGDVDGASIMFSIPEGGDEWRTDENGLQIREINEARLMEVGPVVNPAYQGTTADVREARDRFAAWTAARTVLPGNTEALHRAKRDLLLLEAGIIEQAEKRGALQDVMNDLVDGMATASRPRTDIITSMATAAGVADSNVRDLLEGAVQCPTRSRLAGYARVLEVSIETLIEAAQADGCNIYA